MKAFLLSIILYCCLQVVSAQQLSYISPNNVNAGFGIGGNLFSVYDSIVPSSDTPTNFKYYYVPKDSGISAIFTAAPWLTAFDSTGKLHCAAQRFWDKGIDYFDGPVVTSYNSNYNNYFNRVYPVTSAEVTQFLQLQFPVQASSVPADILNWPGAENPYVSSTYGITISSQLAPFHDADGDGIYNPLKGDYPVFCGDEAVFFVFNDIRSPHTETDGTPLGMEIRGLAYSFLDSNDSMTYEKDPINNTVFVHYEIENKSDTNYSGFYFTLFEDPDLGCPYNDRVGCDTNRNLMFVYNGTEPDPDCGVQKGYGYLPVSHGVKFLNQPASVFAYFTNGQVESQTDPSIPSQYRNYSTGFWNDSTPITYGGTGHGGTRPTKFMFPGDPNDTTQWSEMQVADSFPPGDRRMDGSVGPLSFAIGETKTFDLAFITSYDSTSSMLQIVDTLKRDADIVQQFYSSHIYPCSSDYTLAVNNISNQLLFSVSPNPANNKINIQSGQKIQVLEINNILGQTVLQKQVNDTHISIDISFLQKGVYLIVASNGNSMAIKKIVVD